MVKKFNLGLDIYFSPIAAAYGLIWGIPGVYLTSISDPAFNGMIAQWWNDFEHSTEIEITPQNT